ncbi:hypothetical protein EAE99_002177 [Botrytis elliptica]|nr:hypothetical protein EAE99_002177 [Botrytis elliptica]
MNQPTLLGTNRPRVTPGHPMATAYANLEVHKLAPQGLQYFLAPCWSRGSSKTKPSIHDRSHWTIWLISHLQP